MHKLSQARSSGLNRSLAPAAHSLTTIAFLVAGIIRASAATAADAPAVPAEDKSEAVETIVVTGSRISRRDYEAESPITTLSSSAIAAAGQPSLDRVIGEMPQFEAAQGAAEVGDVQGSVGFGGGASFSDLRGIGRNRSLVLMDGRRLMPSTPDGASTPSPWR
jgi:outer membrane cobalamin receptor